MSKVNIIKIGGKCATNINIMENLAKEISSKIQTGEQFIVVHGGGAEVTDAAKKFGIESKFVNGKRWTTFEEMKVVDAVLAGKINKELVRLFFKFNIGAVGLSGSDGKIFTGEAVDEGSCTGKVVACNSDLLNLLLKTGHTPIVATTSMDKNGNPLNINADDVALELAVALKALNLIYISDIPGVLDKDKKVISILNDEIIKKSIDDEVISGGMIPKVTASASGVKRGIEAVVIGGYENYGDLSKLQNNSQGTKIVN